MKARVDALQIFGSLTGLAAFTASVLLWPGPPVSFGIPQIDESARGAFFDIKQTPSGLFSVGEHGRILYSPDHGRHWRSVQSPSTISLTCLYFVDANNGYAAGYDGLILKTQDGGKTWSISRRSNPQDPAMFALWFKNNMIGLAAGADSTVLRTEDGGKNWNKIKLPKQAHLYSLISTETGKIFLFGENHASFVSSDLGARWKVLPPGVKTSFFCGLSLSGQKFLTAGLRGVISLWDKNRIRKSKKCADENIFSAILLNDNRILLAGQRGKILVSGPEIFPFKSKYLANKENIAAMAETREDIVFASDSGLFRVSKKDLGL